MNKKFQEIYDSNIVHSSFLDINSIENCMKESYDLGVEEILRWVHDVGLFDGSLDQLKLEWSNQKQSH